MKEKQIIKWLRKVSKFQFDQLDHPKQKDGRVEPRGHQLPKDLNVIELINTCKMRGWIDYQLVGGTDTISDCTLVLTKVGWDAIDRRPSLAISIGVITLIITLVSLMIELFRYYRPVMPHISNY